MFVSDKNFLSIMIAANQLPLGSFNDINAS